MPFKANQDRRHRIPRQRHRVTNWPAYEVGLRARGSLTLWFTAEAVAAWRAEPRTIRDGQPRYSGLAITTALTLRAVFRLALRQTEGLIGSILALLGHELRVPDHTTLMWTAGIRLSPCCRPGLPPCCRTRTTFPRPAPPGTSALRARLVGLGGIRRR